MSIAGSGMAFLFFIERFYCLLFLVAHLATRAESRGDAELGQNIGLQKNPDGNDYYKEPYAHIFSFLLCLTFHEIMNPFL